LNLTDRDKPLPGMIPFLRSFYELTTLTREALAAWAIGTLLGVGGCAPSGSGRLSSHVSNQPTTSSAASPATSLRRRGGERQATRPTVARFATMPVATTSREDRAGRSAPTA
jgi:hypothetical protein